jgi:hypothetical protein
MSADRPEPSESNAFLAAHVRLLRESLRRLTGLELCDPSLDDGGAARAVWFAPFVVVSHGTADDPIFNYGNRAALGLFEMGWDAFTSLPSRRSAEAPNRAERARLLAEVTRSGFIRNYSGVRIAKSGRRFRIENATVWNLADDGGTPRGQAAMFAEWSALND